MTEVSKEMPKEMPKAVEKKIFAENRGQYTVVEGQKVYMFLFPASSSLEDNLATLTFMKDEVFKAVEARDKAAKEQEEKNKKESKVPIETK